MAKPLQLHELHLQKSMAPTGQPREVDPLPALLLQRVELRH